MLRRHRKSSRALVCWLVPSTTPLPCEGGKRGGVQPPHRKGNAAVRAPRPREHHVRGRQIALRSLRSSVRVRGNDTCETVRRLPPPPPPFFAGRPPPPAFG